MALAAPVFFMLAPGLLSPLNIFPVPSQVVHPGGWREKNSEETRDTRPDEPAHKVPCTYLAESPCPSLSSHLPVPSAAPSPSPSGPKPQPKSNPLGREDGEIQPDLLPWSSSSTLLSTLLIRRRLSQRLHPFHSISQHHPLSISSSAVSTLPEHHHAASLVAKKGDPPCHPS